MSHDEEATVVMFAYQAQGHCLRSVNGLKSNLGSLLPLYRLPLRPLFRHSHDGTSTQNPYMRRREARYYG